MRAIRRFTVRTVLPEPLAPLDTLAQNLRFSWHEPTRALFESLDPERWRSLHGDPIKLLGALGKQRLDELARDEEVVARVRELDADLREYLEQPRWYQSFDAPDKPDAIAYFSAEFGITAVLPQYSGGLGILAGDHLKSASDLGVPIVGVGLLYGAGYFKQSLTRDGWQHETYPLLDPDNLPLTLLREPDGTPARVSLALPGGQQLHAQVWRADVGRVPLLLLDSNVPENDDSTRKVTDRLYGGSHEHRLRQELLLGMGGVRALRLYSRLTGAPEPQVYHANEGHAGFLAVERIRELVAEEGLSFEAALEAVRAGTVFTTHTPVPAGIDRFSQDLVREYFTGSSELQGVPVDKVLALGTEDFEGGDPAVFNMAVLGLRAARKANGVSRLHGHVSRGMFHQLWPGFDVSEVPITSITNGVHGPTWTDPVFARTAEAHLTPEQIESGEGWLLPADAGGVPDTELWQTRRALRAELVRAARRRVRKSWLDRGASPAELGWVDDVLDPDVLTIGFARRVPTYKRLTLMLRDPERLKRLLTDPERPIQIVVAGKSHPADEPGIGLIRELVSFADQEDVRHRIVFLPNYDIEMAQTLMPGCDVWLNNPLRPLEASGTSGMKCALNGALNLSILDGWWDEWYDGENGWAIPTADGVEDPERRDQLEAAALYELLEETVVPRFYDRDENGIPRHWMGMMRHTLATLGPKVQATRMVRDYVEQLYTPVAGSFRALNGPGHPRAVELAEWKQRVRAAWPAVRVDHVESTNVADVVKVGDVVGVSAYVSLGELRPEDVEVQLVTGRVAEDDTLVDIATRPLELSDTYEGGRYGYRGDVELEFSGSFGYSVRIVPVHELLAGPTEMGLLTVPQQP
ncbi:alpha-glucan family phosphorylase [uncultured Georgenia sp.]|uniref:alpha-glucan family phosphorylase n=1 Tax=uncultured Georgenia sp. TaxID=378209 RepID=UPI002631DA15|nr:alpha-glucan family phosphorylase [uncultured Georgenia sp.]HLV05989.1 alpha-glucan family phosphorylase [Actinomycetaceae bacterium]